MIKKSHLMDYSSIRFTNGISISSRREVLFWKPVFHDTKISLYHSREEKHVGKYVKVMRIPISPLPKGMEIKLKVSVPKGSPQDLGEKKSLISVALGLMTSLCTSS